MAIYLIVCVAFVEASEGAVAVVGKPLHPCTCRVWHNLIGVAKDVLVGSPRQDKEALPKGECRKLTETPD